MINTMQKKKKGFVKDFVSKKFRHKFIYRLIDCSCLTKIYSAIFLCILSLLCKIETKKIRARITVSSLRIDCIPFGITCSRLTVKTAERKSTEILKNLVKI